MDEMKKPVFEERVGPVRVTIWENQDRSGRTFHNVTLVRRYKSGPDTWNSTSSYTGLSDLAQLEEAVRLAQDWLRRRMQPESREA